MSSGPTEYEAGVLTTKSVWAVKTDRVGAVNMELRILENFCSNRKKKKTLWSSPFLDKLTVV
jgi:hypothetical protein